MENNHGRRAKRPTRTQLYLLSEESYEELKNIQGMLTLMAHIAYSEDDNTKGNAMLTIPREEIFSSFSRSAHRSATRWSD
jgi:hypothetical protein